MSALFESVKKSLTLGKPSRRATARLRLRKISSRTFLLKSMTDAARVSDYARFVVTIGKEGEISVLENPNYLLNTISVLAPCRVSSHLISGVVFEIGLSRGRPYREGFIPSTSPRFQGFNSIPGRPKVRDLTEEEVTTLLLVLEGILEKVTAEARNGWANKEPWFVKTKSGVQRFERGTRFTIDASDGGVLEHFVRLSLVDQRSLSRYAYVINQQLRRYKFSHYPESRLKKMKGAYEVAKLCKGLGHLSEYELHHVFASVLVTKRQLLSQIGEVFGVGSINRTPVLSLKKETGAKVNGRRFSIRVVRKGGKVHGFGCLIFELCPKNGQKLLGEIDTLPEAPAERLEEEVPF